MTEGEKLVEKVAEAIYEREPDRGTMGWRHVADWYGDKAKTARDQARAAIAAVREHDKEKGLVHADSTGAERSSDLSAVCFFQNRLYIVQPTQIPAEFTLEDAWPTDDRSAPAASREPDLPSSLLTRLDVPGGLTKGKRD